MIKPPGFDPAKKYPVFMTQYSGPNSNEVLDSWGGRDFCGTSCWPRKATSWCAWTLAAPGHRGQDFRHVTYGQLGKYETEDQIAPRSGWANSPMWTGRASASGLELRRVHEQPLHHQGGRCVQGGHRRGTRHQLALLRHHLHRALHGPAPGQRQGYDDNSPINHVGKLKGNYLLVHGLADDNVHFQNSAEMISALVKANKPFDQFAYPDKNHGIYGGHHAPAPVRDDDGMVGGESVSME
jgi:dipeptidyl-peptidase-4